MKREDSRRLAAAFLLDGLFLQRANVLNHVADLIPEEFAIKTRHPSLAFCLLIRPFFVQLPKGPSYQFNFSAN
jgi:hypothetical protein